MPNSKLMAFIAIIVGAIILGFTGIFVRGAEMPPASANFWRLIFAIAPLYLWMRVDKGAKPNFKQHGLIALAGLLFALDVLFYFMAMTHTSIAKATLLGSMATVFVVVFALFLGEKLTRPIVYALALAVGGTALVISAKGIGQGQLQGDLFALVSALFFAVYVIIARIVRADIGAGAFNFYTVVYCAVFSLGLAFALGEDIWPKSMTSWWFLIALGLLTQTLGQGLTAFGLGKVPAGIASIAMTLNAPIAALASAYILAEYPLPLQIVGGVLILIALVLVRPR